MVCSSALGRLQATIVLLLLLRRRADRSSNKTSRRPGQSVLHQTYVGQCLALSGPQPSAELGAFRIIPDREGVVDRYRTDNMARARECCVRVTAVLPGMRNRCHCGAAGYRGRF